jgi:hypothetical protein
MVGRFACHIHPEEVCYKRPKILIGHMLLLGSPMLDGSKSRSQKRCSLWSSREGTGLGANLPSECNIVEKPIDGYQGIILENGQ